MYVCIAKTGGQFQCFVTRTPAQEINRLRQETGATCEYVFVRKYGTHQITNICLFVTTMTATQIAFYARCPVWQLVTWFNKIAGLRPPKKMEREYIRDDVRRLVYRYNSGLFSVSVE